jgi:hypothetical protein
MKRILFVVLASILIISGFLFWPNSTSTHSQQNAAVLFHGFVKISDGRDKYFHEIAARENHGFPDALKTPHAILCITNTTSVELAYSADSIDYLTSEGWSNNDIMSSWLSPLRHFGDTLKPSEGRTILLPVSRSNLTWRLHFTIVEMAPNYPFNAIGISDLFRVAKTQNHTRTFSGREYELISPEISE